MSCAIRSGTDGVKRRTSRGRNEESCATPGHEVSLSPARRTAGLTPRKPREPEAACRRRTAGAWAAAQRAARYAASQFSAMRNGGAIAHSGKDYATRMRSGQGSHPDCSSGFASDLTDHIVLLPVKDEQRRSAAPARFAAGRSAGPPLSVGSGPGVAHGRRSPVLARKGDTYCGPAWPGHSPARCQALY